MADLFTLENLFNLGVLLFLQAVLGFDNLLYISIESQRAPKEMQARVRRNGILIAIALRVVLLFVMIRLIAVLKEPFFILDVPGVVRVSSAPMRVSPGRSQRRTTQSGSCSARFRRVFWPRFTRNGPSRSPGKASDCSTNSVASPSVATKSETSGSSTPTRRPWSMPVRAAAWLRSRRCACWLRPSFARCWG